MEEITHLVYKIAGVDDAVSRFSPEGYESLSDELTEYLDLVQPSIPDGTPVLLELTGTQLTEAQQAAAERALKAHYGFRLSEAAQAMRACRVKTIWFALSFILSSVLLIFAGSVQDEVLVQFLYLPFWFFGYRVFTFPIFDYLPIRKESQRLERLMDMWVIFTPQQLEEVPADLRVSILEAAAAPARKSVSRKQLVQRYLMRDNIVSLECKVRGLGDLLHPASTPGRQLLSPSIAGYLEQAEPFVKKNAPVELAITGCTLQPAEVCAVQEAISNYYGLRCAQIKQEISANWRKTAVFAACLLVASVVLFLWGSQVSQAGHELMIIALWFFGDYLIEFVLLEHAGLHAQRRKCETIAAMKLVTTNVQEK